MTKYIGNNSKALPFNFDAIVPIGQAVQIYNNGTEPRAKGLYFAGQGTPTNTIASFADTAISGTGSSSATAAAVWLDDTRILMMYRGTNTVDNAVVGTVSGNVPTLGALVSGSTVVASEYEGLVHLPRTGNKAVMNLQQAVSSFQGLVCVSVAGTVPTIGTPVALTGNISNASPAIHTVECGINQVISYYIVAGGPTMSGCISNISGATITPVSPVAFSGSVGLFNYGAIGLCALDYTSTTSTHALAYYANATSIDFRINQVTNASNSITTIGNSISITGSAGSVPGIKIVKYAPGKLLVLYHNSGNSSIMAQGVIYSGTTASLDGSPFAVASVSGGIVSYQWDVAYVADNQLAFMWTFSTLQFRVAPIYITSGSNVIIGPFVTSTFAGSGSLNYNMKRLHASPTTGKVVTGYYDNTGPGNKVFIASLTLNALDQRASATGIVVTAPTAVGGSGRVVAKGDTAYGLAGLTAGARYYIETDNTLTLTNTGYPIGTALSATSLLLV